MDVWIKDKRTPFVRTWRPCNQWRWQMETFRNVGENGKPFVALDVVLPCKDSLPFFVSSVAHIDYSTVLHGMSTGVMPFLPAGGKGVDLPAAVFSSVGEGFERYLCFIYAQYIREVPGLIRMATYKELVEAGERALGPEDLHLFHPQQYAQENFPFVPLQDDLVLSWIRGTDLLTGETVWGPAQIMVMGYAAYGEIPVGFSSSAGLSAGSEIAVVTAHVIREDMESYAYWPGIGVAFDLATALQKALSESAQGQLFLPYMHKVKQAYGKHPTYYYVEEDEDPRHIDNLFKTIVYYGYRKNLECMYREYFDHAPEISLVELEERGFRILPRSMTLSEQVEYIKDIARAHGWHPIVFDLTPPEIKGSASLARVVIPELTPYYTVSLPVFGHPRYLEAPLVLRGENRYLHFEDLNFAPMPFP